MLVGPDNGLLSLVAERAGGVQLAVDVTRSPHRLEPVSATFDGRDVFAPVAAHLAAGAQLAQAGEPLDPDTLVQVQLPEPAITEDGTVAAHALAADRFGNVVLNVSPQALARTSLTLDGEVEITVGDDAYPATYAVTFADVPVGELILYEDAYRMLAIAINRGDARATLGIEPDDEVRLRAR
jgi:S-adenosylmethionine hydrolase